VFGDPEGDGESEDEVVVVSFAPGGVAVLA
jgi:hypothetical protein